MKIEIKNLTVNFFNNTALNIPNLVFEDSLGVVGLSGAGKSVFLRVIAGLAYIQDGEIYFGGKEITDKKPKQRNIAFLNQYTVLFKNKSVYHNLNYPLQKHKTKKAERKAIIDNLGYEQNFLCKKIKELSQKQQIDILLDRALIRKPNLLLIDEPAKFLSDVDYFYSALKKRKAEGQNVQMIIATYNIDDIKQLCEEFLIINGGEVAGFGTLNQLENSQSQFVKAIIK